MPIQNSFGALRRTTRSNVDPLIGGTGWIYKVGAPSFVGAIPIWKESIPYSYTKIYSVISYYISGGNTYASTLISTDTAGNLVSQTESGVTYVTGASVNITGTTVLIAGIYSGVGTINRIWTDNPLLYNLTITPAPSSCRAIDVVYTGDVATNWPTFYTIQGVGSLPSSRVRKFSQTFDTCTQVWARNISSTYKILLKKIYSTGTSATSDVYVAGNYEFPNFSNPSGVYIAKFDYNGTLLWENLIINSDTGNPYIGLGALGPSGVIVYGSAGTSYVGFSQSTGAYTGATRLIGFDGGTCAGLVQNINGTLSTIDSYGVYIPNIGGIGSTSYGRRISNLTDPNTTWTAIANNGTNNVTTNNGVVIGGQGTPATGSAYAITMQIPNDGQIPYTGTYVLSGITFKYETDLTITFSNNSSAFTSTTPTTVWTTNGTQVMTLTGSSTEPTTYTYNKINIGV